MDDRLADFYTSVGKVTLRTWLTETGLQYPKLERAGSGDVGAVRLVDYLDEPPYVAVR